MRAQHVVLFLLSFVATGIGIASLAGPQSNKSVVVLGVTGDWVAESAALEWLHAATATKDANKNLTQIEFLKSDGAQRGGCAAGTGGALAVKFDDDENVYSFPCDTLDDGRCHLGDFPVKALPRGKAFVCVRYLAPKAQGRVASFLTSVWDAVDPLLTESAQLFVSPVSRGLEPELSDSVVLLQAGKLDLSEPLRDLPAGTYEIRMESLSTREASAAGQAQLTVAVTWREGGKAWIDAPDSFRPALYKAAEIDAGKSRVTQAWILVADEKHFDGLHAQFVKAKESVANWPDTVDARAPRTVLRAYLDALSGQK